MFVHYNLTDANVNHTPYTTAIYNQRLLDPFSPVFKNDYDSQVDTLGYLRRTRPDLWVDLGVFTQFAKIGRHGPAHYQALRNIM